MKFLHIDSINGASYNNDTTHNTYAFVDGSISYSPNDYNITCPLPHPLSGVRRIYLKSFSTTILFPTIRQASESNFIILDCSGGTITKTITMIDKIYTSINTLISDLNVASSALYPTDDIVFSISSLTGTLQVFSSTISDIQVRDTNLGYILGFRSAVNSLLTNYCIAPYLYNLAFDTYLNVFITNLNSGYSPNTNRILTSFKVPINAGSYNVNYSSTNLNFEEFIDVSSWGMNITKLDIVIKDRWGYNLHSAGSSLSISLAME